MLAAFSGTLFTGSFLADRLPHVLRAEDGRAAARFPAGLRRWWRSTRSTCGPATSVRGLADGALRPLAALVGVDLAAATRVRDEIWHATLRGRETCVPVLIASWAQSLDGAWRDAAHAALAGDARWCLLFNGTHLRVCDAGATSARRFLDIDLDAAADDERCAHVVWLLAEACFARDPESAHDESVLARVVTSADREGAELRAGLQHGVRDALAHLTGGLLGDREAARAPGALSRAYDEALTAIYRLLFLLFAEARGLVPSWHDVYRESYTVEALRAEADDLTRDAAGMWEAFQAMSRLAHAGCTAGDLHVTAFNGRLFAPHRAPWLDTRAVPDPVVRGAVRALSSVATPRGRTRVSYRDLGVEELGAVYETLLEYEPAAGGPPAGPVVLARTGSERRKSTGTFYTPEAITRYLVHQALDPLVARASSADVLSVRVADPAMGSGAFLVAACRHLADAYEAALVREGRCLPSDLSQRERAGFRRLVAQRCLFGVDVNPMAVHLARLSLWLITLAGDRPLGFLDHHLLVGDSLMGVSVDHVARRPPSEGRVRAAGDRQLPLFDMDDLHLSVRSTVPVRQSLELEPEEDAGDVRRKEAALERLTASGELRRWRELCDLWCATFLGRDRMPRSVFGALVDHVLQPLRSPLAPAVAQHALGPLRSVAADRRFLHWSLELPEVFCDASGRERPDGGFDAVVGNPPWEMVRADAGRLDEGGSQDTTRFTRRSGVYHAQSDGHPNLYQVFLERAVQLTRPGGRLGLVLPHGLATDQGSARLRHLLLRRCATDHIVGFENRAGVFPIHRSVRFLLVTATRGGESAGVRCRFGVQHPEVLDALAEQARERPDAAFPIVLTPALLERLSGPGLAIPDVRTPLDVQLAERMAAMHPRVTDAAGWGARFGRELNASDDRRHFSPRSGAIRVLEGKHVVPFAVQPAGAERFIGTAAARALLPHEPYRRDRLAFRDVASATNRTTLIAAIVPAGCVTTHSLFCLRTPLGRDDQLLLCGLLNSYVANYLVRMRVSSHVTLAILDTLPVPRLRSDDALGHAMLRAVRSRIEGVGEHLAAEPDVQARAAEAYGLSRAEFEHVLSTFPLVAARERDAALARFTEARRR